MSQDFYVKLPFYVTEGTVPRYVSVTFDGELVIPKTEIVSRDMRNPDILTFNVSKDPGIYNMIIEIPDHSFEENGAVILKHFYISNDNIKWYDSFVLHTNTDGSSCITSSLEELAPPHLAVTCGFWFGNSLTFRLEVPTDWSLRYPYSTIEDVISFLDAVLLDPTLTEEKRAILQEKRDQSSIMLIAKNS